MKRTTEFLLLLVCSIFSLLSSLLCVSWIKEDRSEGNALILALLFFTISILFIFMAYKVKSGGVHARYAFAILILSLLSIVTILNVLSGILGIVAVIKLLSKGTEKKKILSIITVSKIYSIDQIAEISYLSNEQTTTLIEKMIKASKTNRDYRIFRNAHINYKNNILVLDTSKQNDLKDQLGKIATSIIDSLTPSENVKQEDWKCSYCGSLNQPENYKCESCNASKE
ncbi:hypothetical protein [Enterococcus rotai]|uniref:hypothetical protein n=1 Tax=Enterococcus rotai TaxID=118060 RepID=UPI0035C761BE